MAFTQTDLESIEAAIMDLATGSRTASYTVGDRAFTKTQANLAELQTLRNTIKYELGLADGTCSPRTYARQGGRG